MTAAEEKEETAAGALLEGGDETKDDDVDDSEDDGSGGGNANVSKKRKERLEQNRISARESRKRKKTMIEELQRTVITLSRENKELNDRNEDLRSKLMGIGAKVRDLR
jgi:predicted RNase H-like nuclease (RuvC/YqgF family)